MEIPPPPRIELNDGTLDIEKPAPSPSEESGEVVRDPVTAARVLLTVVRI
jgi:hypothetical protein